MKHKLLALFKDSNEITDDLKKKFLSNYEDIIKIEESYGKQFTKIIYFNKKVFGDILYDSNKIIEFQSKIYNNNKDNNILSFLFYLVLLISSVISGDNVIIDYSFSIEYIRMIHKEASNKFKNIFLSKIIIDLIHYYKLLNEPEIQYNEELKRLEEENKIIIKNNINILKDLNLPLNEDYIINNKIEDIYSYIIFYLIKNGNFESFGSIDNMMKQLDLENISLPKGTQEKISNFLKENDDINNDEYSEAFKDENYILLNSNEKYITDYMILNIDDLYNEKKLIFIIYYLNIF